MKNRIKNLLAKFWDLLKINAEINERNIVIGSFLSIWAHPLYWVIWTFILPHYYDSAIFRFGVSFLSIVLFFNRYWPNWLKRFLPIFWFLFVMLDLTTMLTFLGLKNGFSGVWIICEIMAIFFAIVLTYNWILVLINIIVGVSSGALIYVLTTENPILITPEYIEYLLPTFFTIFAGVILTHFGRIGVTAIVKKEKDIEFEREKAKAIKALSGTIAHEVRNPLSVIKLIGSEVKNLVDELDDESTPQNNKLLKEKLLHFDQTINNSIKRANDIIDITLKDIKGQKLDSSAMKYLSASAVIKEALEEYGYKDLEQKSKVKFLSDQEDFTFKGDETLVIYILFNLIKNALYYSDKYPKSIVTIHLDKSNELNKIMVRDEGPGIPKDKIKTIFEPFNTSGKIGGTGLGLPFCKRAMDSMNGEISCDSKLGEFTQFSLSFPIVDESIKPSQTNQNQQTKSNKELLKAKFKGKRILLADDEQINRMVLGRSLKSYGAEIFEVADGDELVQEYINNITASNQIPYDLIITDINMQKVHAGEAIKKIREFETKNNITNPIKIIIHSANKDELTIQDLMKEGANGFLLKGDGLEEVLN